MKQTLLTAKELSARTKFSANYINAELRDSIFIEGKHTSDHSMVEKFYTFGKR